MQKLYIVDALNFLFRSHHGIPPMTNSQGESTNALYGFIRSIHAIRQQFPSDYFIIVFDGPDNKKSRSELYADYKIHRKKMPEELVPQLEKAINWCKMAGFATACVPGVEADDVIGSMARWAEEGGAQVFICSGDKDLCQLVNDKTFVLNPYKENLLIDAAMVKTIYGVHPHQIVDYLAIVGDASDNIPGLTGFGPKTAAQLLEEFGSLDAILENIEKVPGAKKQAVLREEKEIALLSRKLAQIDTNTEFTREKEAFCVMPPQYEELKEFYDAMHFMSFLKTLDAPAAPTQKTQAEIKEETDYELIVDEAQLSSFLEELKHSKEICLDLETTDIDPIKARIVGVGLGIKPSKAVYIPFNGTLDKGFILKELSALLEHQNSTFYGHNIKYDLHVLLNEKLPYPNISFDTILASYLTSPQNPQHNLDQLSLEKFHKVKIPIESLIGKGKNQISMAEVPLKEISSYCCEDVDYTIRLKELFEKELDQKNLRDVFDTIEIPLIRVLIAMEKRGIYVENSELKLLSSSLEKEISQIVQSIYQEVGEEFNLNSPKQLAKILFEKLQIKPLKKTKTGLSTSAQILEEIQDASPIIPKILEYRTLEKLRSTYVDTLPSNINTVTGRIHCNFNQSVAATGRLSSQNPNLQNIPIRSPIGKQIRAAFRPQESDWSFISADYSQIELRLLAHLSEDPSLLHAFNEGEDIHTYTASLVFNVPLKDVTAQMRQRAKTVNFGVLYGQQAFALSQSLKISYHEATDFINTYFLRYKTLKEFFENCKENARKTGYAITLTGRKRPIPEIQSPNTFIRSAAERLAINTPLQGTAADLIKLAMIELDASLKSSSHNGHILLQIHDELLLEAPDSSIMPVADLAKKIMENTFKLKVPLKVDISIGKNWGEC